MVASVRRKWQNATVAACRDVAQGVRRVELDMTIPVRAAAGSHVDVLLPGRRGGLASLRSYSVVESSQDGVRIALSVNLSPTSRGGSEFMHRLNPGDSVRVTQPLQNFPLSVGAPRYVLVAGGIGITALVGMASVLRKRGADYCLVYVGRSRSKMAYLEELQTVHGQRVTCIINDEGGQLRVGELVNDIAGHELAQRTECYMCGPIPLMDDMRQAWAGQGLPAANLRFETFGNTGSTQSEPFTVEIPALSRSIEVTPEATMLEALEQADMDVMSDCRKGECGLCQVRVLAITGRIDHRDVFFSEEEQATQSSLCMCVSRIVSDDGRGSVHIELT